MSLIGERLRANWLAQGIDPPGGVSEERLFEFEDRHGVTLPADMRSYFLYIDGMGSRNVSDHGWFSFWPLGEVIRASQEFEDAFMEDQSSYFLFADHSIFLPSYAIRLTRSASGPHPTVAIYSDQKDYSTSVVARSFSEFVQRYLADETSRCDLGVGGPIRP